MTARLAELPRVTPNFDGLDFSGAVTVSVPSGGDIAAALDTVISQLTGPVPMGRVLLAAGGTYTLTNAVVLKKFGSTGWIEITTNTTLPALGTRILPSTGGSLATIHIPDFQSGFNTEAGASGYRIRGVKMVCSTTQDTHPFIALQPNAGVNIPSDLATRMSIRQCLIQGNAANSTRRFGITMNGQMMEICDNYIVHLNMNGVDYSQQSQSCTESAGLGKLRIENNFLWRSSEGIAFGGANQWPCLQPEQRLPSDITIRRNHLYMPLSYKGVEQCANGIEFKQGRRVLIEYNIIENVWTDSQPGYGLVMWSANQYGANEPWVDSCDFTVRYNWFKNCSGNWENSSVLDPVNEPSIYPRRYNIHNNLSTGYGSSAAASPDNTANTQRAFAVQASVTDVRYANNTVIGPAGTYVFVPDPSAYTRLEITDNVMGTDGAPAAILFTSSGTGQAGWNLMNANGDCIFSGNVVVDGGTGTTPNTGTNAVLAALADVGFADATKNQSTTVKYADLSALVISGAHAGKGCDITGLISGLNGVECPTGDLPT